MQRIISTFVLSLCTLGLVASGVSAAGIPAKVTDLAWMSGHWEGPVGNDGTILEVNWTPPKGGSIATLDRDTKAGATTLIELIVIEEKDGSLVLHLQQWDPGYKPRPEGVLVMKLSEIGNERVMFEAVGEGMLKKVGYRREGEKLTISVTTAQGVIEVPLARTNDSAR